MPSNKEDQNISKDYTNNLINIIAKKKETSQTPIEREIKNIDTFLIVAINKIISNLLLYKYFDYSPTHSNCCWNIYEQFQHIEINLIPLI